jgi:8-oxo-dGTP pyrophosphatase MutT (NUDIX family)
VPERIVVVAAVIEQDGRFLVARRLKGTHLAGYWEFPGGKVHQGESRRRGRFSTPLMPIPS